MRMWAVRLRLLTLARGEQERSGNAQTQQHPGLTRRNTLPRVSIRPSLQPRSAPLTRGADKYDYVMLRAAWSGGDDPVKLGCNSLDGPQPVMVP
jgi:hypothetical protein